MRKLTVADSEILIEKLLSLDVQKMQFWYEGFDKQILWKNDSDAIVITKKDLDWKIATWSKTGDGLFEYASMPLRNFTRNSLLQFSQFPIMARLRLMRVVFRLERNLTAYNERVKAEEASATALKAVELIVGMSDE